MDLAGKTGMTRAGLYKALAPGGNSAIRRPPPLKIRG
jgi:DNA-binding phage protein